VDVFQEDIGDLVLVYTRKTNLFMVK